MLSLSDNLSQYISNIVILFIRYLIGFFFHVITLNIRSTRVGEIKFDKQPMYIIQNFKRFQISFLRNSCKLLTKFLVFFNGLLLILQTTKNVSVTFYQLNNYTVVTPKLRRNYLKGFRKATMDR